MTMKWIQLRRILKVVENTPTEIVPVVMLPRGGSPSAHRIRRGFLIRPAATENVAGFCN
jgi:hypothetical protein